MSVDEGRFNHLTISHAGRRWTGDWVQQGREVCVSSAYGSRRCAVGRRQPERVAAEILKELVDGWRTTR